MTLKALLQLTSTEKHTGITNKENNLFFLLRKLKKNLLSYFGVYKEVTLEHNKMIVHLKFFLILNTTNYIVVFNNSCLTTEWCWSGVCPYLDLVFKYNQRVTVCT